MEPQELVEAMKEIESPKATKESRLESLGFKRAARELLEIKVRQRKLAVAYEHYRFVRQEKIQEFNDKLRASARFGETYKILDFISIEDYDKVPPESVLASLETAQGLKCFDVFEVAYIREVKDPILFGIVKGCSDKFYIDQWDSDVSIDDLIKENEG